MILGGFPELQVRPSHVKPVGPHGSPCHLILEIL